jgi:hypothetical protein
LASSRSYPVVDACRSRGRGVPHRPCWIGKSIHRQGWLIAEYLDLFTATVRRRFAGSCAAAACLVRLLQLCQSDPLSVHAHRDEATHANVNCQAAARCLHRSESHRSQSHNKGSFGLLLHMSRSVFSRSGPTTCSLAIARESLDKNCMSYACVIRCLFVVLLHLLCPVIITQHDRLCWHRCWRMRVSLRWHISCAVLRQLTHAQLPMRVL